MPRSPFYQTRDTTELADSLAFDEATSNDIWSLGFSHAADQAISGLSNLLKMPEPLPVIVSDRPEAKPVMFDQPAVAMPQGEQPSTSQSATTEQSSSTVDLSASPQAGGTSTFSSQSTMSGPSVTGPTPSGAATAAAPPMPTGQPSASQDLRAYARQKAQSLGINPDIAERVANTEGGFDNPVRQNMEGAPAYGPYQLYIGGPGRPGLGDEAIARGIDPRRPEHARAAVDFALEHAAKNGWSAFQGAAANGIGNWEGIGQQGAAQTPRAAAGETPSSGPAPRQTASSTYTQQGLADAGDPDAWAKCGPVAAYQFALKTGRNPTPTEVEKLAKDAGWTPAKGMAGFQSEAKVLAGLNIAARAEDGVDWDKVITDVSRGNPVILQLPGHEGHYITAQAYDPKTGKIDFGSTVGDLRASGHKTQFTPTELENLGWGKPTASLYLDNPATPAPSVAAGANPSSTPSSVPSAAPTTPSTTSPSQPGPTPSPTSPQEILILDNGLKQGPAGQMKVTRAQWEQMDQRFWKIVGTEQGSLPVAGASAPQSPPTASAISASPAASVIANDQLLMLRQPLNQQTPGDAFPLNDASASPPDASTQVPPWEQQSPPPAVPGAGSFQDTQTEPAPAALIPANQVQPQEDPTAYPRPAYVPPASPLVEAPATDPAAPPSPYDAGQAASMEPPPDRFIGPTETQRALSSIPARSTGLLGEGTRPQSERDAANAFGLEASGQTAPPINAGGIPASDLAMGGMVEQLDRMHQIQERAAAYYAAEGKTDKTNGMVAVRDPKWRAAYPDLAQEYDDLQVQVALNVGGQVGDVHAAGVSGPSIVERAQPIAQRAADVLDQGVQRGREIVSDIGTNLRENAGRVAALDAERAGTAAAPAYGTLGAVPEQAAEDTSRFYHGTASDFPYADPGKFDERGLYGPGYYLTDNPVVAGSYSEARSSPALSAHRRLADAEQAYTQAQQDVAALQRGGDAAALKESQDRLGFYERALPTLRNEAEQAVLPAAGPNVRPLDVPNDLSLFDLDRQFTNADGQTVSTWLEKNASPDIALTFDEALPPNPTGDDIYRALTRAYENDKTAVNDVLSRVGFDGVAHTGGQRVPMLDAAGSPIEHEVRVIFPDALPRIRQAYSGEYGGAALGTVPEFPGQPRRSDPLARATNVLSQGAASAISGGVGAATNQQLNPDDPNAGLKGFAVGAVAPLALSRGARALARGRGASEAEGALATFGVGGRPKAQSAANAADPVIRNVGRQMEGDYRVVPTPDPRTRAQRIADAFATAWTDNRAGLYRLQNSVSEAIGRPLHADEMVAELSRLNPASTASQRLSENLRPSLQKVGEDQDWLAQYLVHSHNLDVAREMGQRAYDDAIKAGRSPIVASRQAMQAANTRSFSGDLNMAQTQQALQAIESTVKGFPEGATRWQAIQDGAQAVWGHNRDTLQRKLDAGMISQDMFNDLTQRYPRYVRTDIADYFERGSGAAKPSGRTIGTSDIGIQKLDPRGTGKDRVNPLLSTIDQTYTAESAIQRNVAGQAFANLVDQDPRWAGTFREVLPERTIGSDPATVVPDSYKLRGKEQFLTVWDGGDSRTFVIPGEFATLVAPQGGKILGDSAIANGWRAAMNIYKGLITSKNPAFSLLVSPIRDAGDYAIKEATASARHQGPLGAAEAIGALPGVVADYVKAVPAAFEGTLQGQFKGDLAAMMRAGAGQGSRPGHTDKELRQALRELSRAGGIQINNVGDLGHVLGNVLTLGAEPLGGRLEQVPRLAAARRAAKRGASETEQAMAFRDATVDFQRGGDIAKALNAAVPFLNTTVQGGAQVARTARQNPAAFVAAVASTIGLATAASETWNHSDPQMAADYKDVPDYLKKTGIIFMLPRVVGSDQRGDRRPNFVWLPTGSYGAFTAAARDAIQKTGSGEPGADLSTLSGWGQLTADVGGTFSPLRGDSAGSALTSLIPPPLSTAADLVGNKDLYRGSTIATDRADQNASAMAQSSASGFNRVTGQETRPSQWDYLYRDLGGFAASAIGEASNMVAEEAGMRPRQQEQRPIQDFPIAGGVAGRIVRDNVGQGLQDTQDERASVPEGIRPTLQEVGLRRDQVTAVPSTLQNIPLTRAEQADWQDRTNNYIEREVEKATRSGPYRARGADQQKIIQDAISAAKEKAANEVLRTIPPTERSQRIRDAQAQKAS